ncbi:MAG TPA: hypothetical protein VJ965_05065 [Anaerolineales bacterium]|nr:hypothetical protein [Anaerolineales bacterium]
MNVDTSRQGRAYSFSLIRMFFNIAFWVFLLPFFTAVEYKTGFILMTVVIFIRLSANLYVNILDFNIEQYDQYPLRS